MSVGYCDRHKMNYITRFDCPKCRQEEEDAVNAYAQTQIKRERLHANDGREGQDRDTSGMPLKPGG